MAVYVGDALLLVRPSYRAGWHFPGGGVRRGETPEEAARRELAEEIGLTASVLVPVGFTCTSWDGRRDRVYFFELRLAELPTLKLDNREIIEARLISPGELRNMIRRVWSLPISHAGNRSATTRSQFDLSGLAVSGWRSATALRPPHRIARRGLCAASAGAAASASW